MAEIPLEPSGGDVGLPSRLWHRELNRYHWFVLIVAALGWMFDCLDQQLFLMARPMAMKELLAGTSRDAIEYGGYATAIFLIGWGAGGLAFGVLGDRIGRAKTMMLTILVYSACTGLSALSRGFWDFAAYRFLTGLGVGGEFAVGVALVAEAMPQRVRAHALGFLQALSAVGNIAAALIVIWLSQHSAALEQITWFGPKLTAWRAMFLVGAAPALLALLVRLRLKEPERWQAAAHDETERKSLGSYRELFGDPRWRRRAIAGMLLASSGVVGLWGIGFYSGDLSRSVFRAQLDQQARDTGQAEQYRQFVATVIAAPDQLGELKMTFQPSDLLSPETGTRDAEMLFATALELDAEIRQVSVETVLKRLDQPDEKHGRPAQSAEDRRRREAYLADAERDEDDLEDLVKKINHRAEATQDKLTLWSSITLMAINVGAFFGMSAFGYLAEWLGRRTTFVLAFVSALASTTLVFRYLSAATITIGGVTIFSDVFWMMPLMGFCLLSIFGGYAIYFPELFPTRLRSTGTSFCYNVGRFVAASGPYTLGLLASRAFVHTEQPLRWAGLCMCSVFLVGLAVLPFLPETKGQPLPE